MKVMSSLEISCGVKELQELVGAKVNKVYQPNKSEIVVDLHKTGKGKVMLRVVPGQCLYITDKKLPSPKTAFNFCMFLRKRLTGTRLREVRQKDFERVVEFSFEGFDSYFRLVAEFFSKGNIILCDREYNIISALQVQIWRDREIKARVKYEYPPNSNLDIFSVDLESFRNVIKKSGKSSVVKALAVDVGLGGLYAEELCLRAKVDKSKKPTLKDIEGLFRELKKFSYLNICAFFLGDDAVPFDMLFYKGVKKESVETFNQALNLLYSQYMDIKEENPYVKKIEEQERILKSQELQVDSMEKGMIENKEKGDLIYRNYQFVKEVIDVIRKARDKKIPWDEIEKKLKTRGVIVKGKEGIVSLDLE